MVIERKNIILSLTLAASCRGSAMLTTLSIVEFMKLPLVNSPTDFYRRGEQAGSFRNSRRPSIIDTLDLKQVPLASWCIVWNVSDRGEIYNHSKTASKGSHGSLFTLVYPFLTHEWNISAASKSWAWDQEINITLQRTLDLERAQIQLSPLSKSQQHDSRQQDWPTSPALGSPTLSFHFPCHAPIQSVCCSWISQRTDPSKKRRWSRRLWGNGAYLRASK